LIRPPVAVQPATEGCARERARLFVVHIDLTFPNSAGALWLFVVIAGFGTGVSADWREDAAALARQSR
jgi:hypothetical protein